MVYLHVAVSVSLVNLRKGLLTYYSDNLWIPRAQILLGEVYVCISLFESDYFTFVPVQFNRNIRKLLSN